eukprot:scaffold1739_cov242-Pinguiococcus_pyrenoidosus.AAC.6
MSPEEVSVHAAALVLQAEGPRGRELHAGAEEEAAAVRGEQHLHPVVKLVLAQVQLRSRDVLLHHKHVSLVQLRHHGARVGRMDRPHVEASVASLRLDDPPVIRIRSQSPPLPNPALHGLSAAAHGRREPLEARQPVLVHAKRLHAPLQHRQRSFRLQNASVVQTALQRSCASGLSPAPGQRIRPRERQVHNSPIRRPVRPLDATSLARLAQPRLQIRLRRAAGDQERARRARTVHLNGFWREKRASPR